MITLDPQIELFVIDSLADPHNDWETLLQAVKQKPNIPWNGTITASTSSAEIIYYYQPDIPQSTPVIEVRISNDSRIGIGRDQADIQEAFALAEIDAKGETDKIYIRIVFEEQVPKMSNYGKVSIRVSGNPPGNSSEDCRRFAQAVLNGTRVCSWLQEATSDRAEITEIIYTIGSDAPGILFAVDQQTNMSHGKSMTATITQIDGLPEPTSVQQVVLHLQDIVWEQLYD